MKKTNILLCDRDKDYIDAFASYLINPTIREFNSICVTVVYLSDDPKQISGEFDLGFICEEFSSMAEKNEKLLIKKTIIFQEEKNDEKSGYFKYQSMDNALSIVYGEQRLPRLSNKNAESNIIGVYSPVGHDLTLIFALCIGKLLSERKETVVIDLSEIDILSKLTDRDFTKDVTDLIYVLSDGEKCDINQFINESEGISYISTSAVPAQLSYVTEKQWMSLIKHITKLGFENIVVCFGTLPQGFLAFMEKMSNLYVVARQGDYYKMKERAFMDYIDNLGMGAKCKQVDLNFSVANLAWGSFRLDGILNSKLMDFVKEIMV